MPGLVPTARFSYGLCGRWLFEKLAYSRSDIREAGWCPDCGEKQDDCRCGGPSDSSVSTSSYRTSERPGDHVESIRFVVPGRPASKPNGRQAHQHPTADYEEAVGLYASRALPPEWPKTDRYHLQVGILYADKRVADNTNVLKAIEDGLTGVVWHDDAQVDTQSTFKTVRDGRDDSVAVVRVERLTTALDDHAIPCWMGE